MSATNVLHEVVEALVPRVSVKAHGGTLEIVDLLLVDSSAEDVLQSLPEHLWSRIRVTRVAPGRFVVDKRHSENA